MRRVGHGARVELHRRLPKLRVSPHQGRRQAGEAVEGKAPHRQHGLVEVEPAPEHHQHVRVRADGLVDEAGVLQELTIEEGRHQAIKAHRRQRHLPVAPQRLGQREDGLPAATHRRQRDLAVEAEGREEVHHVRQLLGPPERGRRVPRQQLQQGPAVRPPAFKPRQARARLQRPDFHGHSSRHA